MTQINEDIYNTMENLLLRDTLQLIHEAADIDVFYYFIKDHTLFKLDKTEIQRTEYSYKEFLKQLHPADSIIFDNSFNSIVSGEIHYSNTICRKKSTTDDRDYKLYNFHIINHKCENGEIDYVMFSMKNITDIVPKQRKETLMLDKYQTIFYNLPFATVCFEESGRVIEANSYAIAMVKEWFGKDIFEINFINSKFADDKMRKCFHNHESFTRDIKCCLANGDSKFLKSIYVPIPDDNSKFLGHMMMLGDITSEKNMAHSNDIFTKKMKMVTEHYGLIHLDCFPDKRTFNLEGGHSLTHMEQIPIEVAYGMLHPDDRHILQDIVEDTICQSFRTYEAEFRMHMANHDDYRTVNLSLIPNIDDDGHLICYTGLMEDITDRIKQFEEKENTLRELRAAMEKAEESDKLKSAFLANISHEIRTPLNAIIGFSELLMNGQNMANRDEFSKIIRTNADRLLHLIGDILDLSKLESGSIKFDNKEFEVDGFIRELYDTYKFYLDNSNIDFKLSLGTPCKIYADESRIREILTNFLNNAVKYTSKGSITLKYSFDGKAVKMSVEDTGIGIKQECLDKVFNRFEKLGSLVPGTGLGLTICKNIMNILKGDIGVESKFGEGSTFWISLPAEKL